MTDLATVMRCPCCFTALSVVSDYHEGEDEFGTNELHWYAEWHCPSCGHVVKDCEDEFMFVDDGRVVADD